MWRGELLFLGSECGELHVWNSTTLTQLDRAQKHSGEEDGLQILAHGLVNLAEWHFLEFSLKCGYDLFLIFLFDRSSNVFGSV